MVSFKGYTLLLKAAGRAWVEQPGGASLSKLVCCSFGPGRRDRGSICSPKSFCPMLKTSLYTRKPLSGALLYLFFLLFLPLRPCPPPPQPHGFSLFPFLEGMSWALWWLSE